MKNIAKRINAAARPIMIASNLRTRVVRSKKNDPHLSRREWKQDE